MGDRRLQGREGADLKEMRGQSTNKIGRRPRGRLVGGFTPSSRNYFGGYTLRHLQTQAGNAALFYPPKFPRKAAIAAGYGILRGLLTAPNPLSWKMATIA
jgi:hypothetical protein